ncbi:MAG: hypothetical protein AAF213_02475 [Pseudomonadota bacterium]
MPGRSKPAQKHPMAAPPLTASVDEIMDHFFDGKKKYIYDDFPHKYFAEKGSEYKDRARAQIAMAFGAVKASTGGQQGNYVLCSISGGIEGHRLAYIHKDKFKEAGEKLSTVKLGEFAGSDIVAQRVYGPNTVRNLALTRDVQRAYPEEIAIAPAGLQAMVHQFGASPGFSRGQKWEEEDYMGLWFMVKQYFEKRQPLSGDPNFSRGANWELMYGASVQAGVVPGRDAKGMDVVDGKGRDVNLYRRMKAVSDYVRWAAPKGFDVSVGATTLVRLMHMSDQIQAAKAGKDSVIDLGNLHPVMRKRTKTELQQVAKLKAQMGPFLAKHAADQIDTSDLGDEWVEELMAGDPKVRPATERKEQIAFDDWGTQQSRRAFAGFDDQARDIHVYDLKGDYFDPSSHSVLFEDDHFSRLTERERLILPFLIAASETALPPAAKPHVALVLGDPKTGAVAIEAAAEAGLDDIAELPGYSGKDFAAIAADNVRDMQRVTQKLRRQFNIGIIRSSAEFDEMFDVAGKHGDGVIAPGANKVGSEARVAFRNKMLDRQVDRVVAMDGWEMSGSYVQHMVRATLIQSGLVPRQSGSGQDFVVYDQRGQEMSLADRIKPLAKFVETAIQNDVAVPEQSLALARLFELYDRQVDPTYSKRKGVEISAQVAHPAVTTHLRDDKERQALKEIRDRVRPLLIEHASGYIDQKRIGDLNEDYQRARDQWLARSKAATARTPGASTIYSTGNRPTRG